MKGIREIHWQIDKLQERLKDPALTPVEQDQILQQIIDLREEIKKLRDE